MSSECNVKENISNACNEPVCLMNKKSLSENVCDDIVSNVVHVNDTPSKKDVPLENTAKTRYIHRLIAKSRKTTSSLLPRNYLKMCVWIPTGREFSLENGRIKMAKEEPVKTVYDCISPVIPNTMEPNDKRFPNAQSSVIGRLSKYVFGSSTRVAPST